MPEECFPSVVCPAFWGIWLKGRAHSGICNLNPDPVCCEVGAKMAGMKVQTGSGICYAEGCKGMQRDVKECKRDVKGCKVVQRDVKGCKGM